MCSTLFSDQFYVAFLSDDLCLVHAFYQKHSRCSHEHRCSQTLRNHLIPGKGKLVICSSPFSWHF
jgi:hypothetical protein